MCPTPLSKICIIFELQLPSYHKKKEGWMELMPSMYRVYTVYLGYNS